MTTAQTELLVAPKPFAPDVVRGHLLHGQTIAQGLTAAVRNGVLTLDDVPLVRVYVMGEPLAWEDALDYVPADGEVVTVVVEPQGGDTGRTIFQLFYTIGAAVVGFYLGPWAAAAVQIAGTVATNLIWRPDRDNLAAGRGAAALQGAGNRSRVRDMMPLVLGKQRVELDLAGMPYTQNIGSDVWLTVPFAVHYGAVEVTDEKLGETLLTDYPAADYQVERFLTPGPRNSTLYPSRVVQENLQDQLDFTGGGVWEVHTASEGAARIEVDITLPSGLKYNSPNSGKVRTEQVSGRIEYAEVGTEDWVLARNWSLDMKTNDAVRRTYGFDVDPAKHYKVRSKAWDPNGEYPQEEGRTWVTYWTALRSIYQAPAFLDENLALIILRVKSSDDLNGNLPTFSAVAEPICEVFDEGTGQWGAPVATSNPAAVLRWLMTGPAPAEPLAPAEINSSFAEHFVLARDRSWLGGMVVQENATQEEVMLAMGRMGRFSTYWNGEQLCLVPDWEKPIARQLFTGRNVEGYAYQRNLPDPIHAVLVEFRNRDMDDRGDELWVYADGYTAETAEDFINVRIDFSCTKERAYREGRVFLAKYELQVETHEWSAGADSVVATFGDRVRLRHSVGLIGQSEARVQFRRWQGGVVGGLVTGVRLDTAVTMEAGKSYALDCRLGEEDPDVGMLLDVEVTTTEGTVRDLVFPAPLQPSLAPAKGDLVAFGEQGLVTEDLEVLDVKPNGDSARFYAQRYLAEEIEAAETGPVPELPTTLQPREQAPKPRFIGDPIGDPAGVQVAFDIDPSRADQVAFFAPRWRRLSDQENGDWTSLPLLSALARQVVTPPLPAAAIQPDDTDPDYVVQIDLRTVMRSGDLSQRAQTGPIEVYRTVPPPTGFVAQGLTRQDASGATYPVLYVSVDPMEAGDVQDLVVEIRPTGGLASDWRPAGQPLPAANPRGDMLSVEGGTTVDVRARWRVASNWVSTWVQTDVPVVIPNSRVSSDTVNIGGVNSSLFVMRVDDVESLSAANALAVSDLEAIYGDTVSAAESAAAAALSEANIETLASEVAGDASAAATSAAGALASEGAAGSSAAAADTSAVNAATAAGGAATSATNAATSEEDADGHRALAASSASNAANSADAAGGSASAAAGSASSAATDASSAGSSAAAAAASQVAAEAAYGATVLVGGNTDFSDGLVGWSSSSNIATGLSLAITFLPALEGKSNVAHVAAGQRGTFYTVKRFQRVEGRKYRFRAIMWVGPGAGPGPLMYAGIRTFDADGVATHSNNQYFAAGAQRPANGSGWHEYVSAVITDSNFYAGTTQFCLMAFTNFGNESVAETALDGIWVEDVTESEEAATSATAAATQASNAAASAGDAGDFASAASGSATTAATRAGEALTYRDQSSSSADDAQDAALAAGTSASNAAGSAATASTQASNATAEAVKASASASIAAAIGLGSLNRNPMFTDWPGPGTGADGPEGWAWYSPSNGSNTKVAGINGSPNAIRSASSSTSNFGILSSYTQGSTTGGEWVVVEADITLDSGNLMGSGVYLAQYAGGTNNGASIRLEFHALPDAAGVVRGAGVAGTTYRYRFLVDARLAGTTRYIVYGMTRWSSFPTNPVGAATITWHRLSVRAATSEEIATRTVLGQLGASVSEQATALANIVDGYALARYQVSATTSGGAAVLSLVSDDYGSVAGLSADQIYFGANTFFDNATDTMRTIMGGSARVVAYGAAFGTDGQLTEWEGPAATAYSAVSRANAYFYRANVAPYVGGIGFASGQQDVKVSSFSGNIGDGQPLTTMVTTTAKTVPSTGKFIVDVTGWTLSNGEDSLKLATGTITVFIVKGGVETSIGSIVATTSSLTQTALPGFSVEVAHAYAGSVQFRLKVVGGGSSTSSTGQVGGSIKVTHISA